MRSTRASWAPAVREYSSDDGDFRQLTFPDLVVGLFAPWGKGSQDWVVHSVEVRSGTASTARGVGLGDGSEKVRRVYGDLTVRYEPASGLIAFGNRAYLSFGVNKDSTVNAISLGTNNEGQAGQEEAP